MHYNLSETLIPGAILTNDNRCFFSDYHTTASHMRKFAMISDIWTILEDREETILADTDGGCDRSVTVTYTHELDISTAIFYEEQVIGIYLDFKRWNGYSDKPNSHTFIFDNITTHIHHNTHSVWRLIKK